MTVTEGDSDTDRADSSKQEIMPNRKNNDKFTELREKAKELLTEKQGTDLSIPLELEAIIQELQVHHTELEIQHEELQRTYERLEQAQKKLHSLFEFAPAGYVVIEPSGVIERANLTAAAMLGTTRSALEGSKLEEFVTASHQETYYLHRRQLQVTREPQTADVQLRQKGDGVFYARLDSVYVEEDDRYRVAITDITTIKKAEDTLRANLDYARELDDIKNKLLSMISHELRTPLTTILNAANMLERYGDRLSEDRRAARFQTIKSHIWYLNSMVSEVVSAYRAGEMEPHPRPERFNVREFCQQMVEDMELDGQERIEKHVQIADDEPDAEAIQDLNFLRQMVTNLLNNALNYSEDTVHCHLNCTPDELILIVSDEGIGIPEEEQDAVFAVFTRGSNTTGIPGTGIGLAIVRRAVKACNGTLHLQSQPGQGTTFTITMPRYLDDDETGENE
jgi:PAS domain S-box-containing protein